MRLPGGAFLLLPTGKKGAILEPTDAQLVVPAVIQPVVEIPNPLVTATVPGAGLQESTFTELLQDGGNDAIVGRTTASAFSLRAGLWHIRGQYVMQFSGTTKPFPTQMVLQLFDGTNFQGHIAVGMANGVNATGLVDLVISTLIDGWLFRVGFGTTVAGDIVRVSFGYIASRLLI